MRLSVKKSPEYTQYLLGSNWPALKVILHAGDFSQDPLFTYLYGKTKRLYASMKPRKNGENPFVHPINLVHFCVKAGIKNPVVLSSAIIHDYIEEQVDLYKSAHKLNDKKQKDIRILDKQERIFLKEFEEELTLLARKNKISTDKVNKIVESTKLLTRHKRDYYYQSIKNIFTYSDEDIKEIAVQVKLADRIHNILCIDCFDEKGRIYQCFKNLFILNSVKRYLQEKRGSQLFTGKLTPTEKLFKKCCKATYNAFLKINHVCNSKKIMKITPLLQLAFKKFALEQDGVWEVTKVSKNEKHLMRLFHGVIRKYDLRLHHEKDKFNKRTKEEILFCKRYFADYKFKDHQLQAIIDYKDAYSLKEVMAYLMYLPNYVLDGFEYTKLFRK